MPVWTFLQKGLAGAAIFFSLGTLLYGLLQDNPTQPMTTTTVSTEHAPGHMEQLSYDQWEGNELLWRVKADDFLIKRRGYLAFQVRSLEEVVLRNAHFKLFQHANQKDFSFFAPLQQALFSSMRHHDDPGRTTFSRPYISQGVFLPVSLTIYEGNHPFISLKAQSGIVKGKSHRVEFSHVSLEHLDDHRKIHSQTVFWDDEQKKFLIPGSYLAETSKGWAQGKGLGIGLDFSLVSLP